MKKLYLLLITLLCSLNILAQAPADVKQDVILKINGEEMKGKVTKISDSTITFIYTGETLEYTIKKADILKITHSSGRVEIINQPPLPSEAQKPTAMQAAPVDHHNKIAILPFSYLIDNRPGADQIGYKAQDDTYAFLSQHSASYTILDTRTTNALLIKNGITRDKMMGFTMKEICDVLGVEYVIDGTVTQNRSSQTSSSSGSSNTTVKKDDNNKDASTYGSSSSYSAQLYSVSVSLNIYTDNNKSIYNQSHKGFWANTDGSYNSPLEYLLKRCPLYKN